MWNKVLLIYPNIKSRLFTDQFKLPPLGLQYLASQIEDLTQVEIFDVRNFEFTLNDIRKKVIQYEPDLVGISCNYTSGIKHVLNIAEIIKKALNNNCEVILGGWHPTLTADEILDSNYVDAVIRGEGEYTLREMIKTGRFENIRGVSYKENGNKIHNPERPLIEDLNKLKFPKRSKNDYKKYNMLRIPYEAIETSRGCPFTCEFCCIHEFYHHKWRGRSPMNIIRELYKIYQNTKKRDILIVDDNFGVNMNRVKDFCELILKSRLNLHFTCQIRVDDIVRNPKIVNLMTQAGFWAVFIGIESISDSILNDLNKKISLSKILKAIKILNENNILIIGNVIIGSDFNASEKTIIENIKKTCKLKVDYITFSMLTPLPKTKIFDKCKKENLILTYDWTKYNMVTSVLKTRVAPEKFKDFLEIAQNTFFQNISLSRLIKKLIKSRGLIFLLQNLVRFIFIWVDIIRILIEKYDKKKQLENEKIS
ncbi:MAG: radical SAM protein [Promethearchaeota archaeon]|nr:MAG: radical SAM protein [Candidatus Lokiarchaeota archaeon]